MTGSSSSSSSRSNPWLISHDELPDWATDNHFIVAGYRRPGGWTTEAQKGKTLGSKHANGSSNASSTATDMIAYEHNTFRKCWNSMYIAHAPIFYPASISFAPSSGSSGIANANASRAGWFSLAHVPTEYSHPPGVRDIAGFGTFFLGSVVCLGFSATFHCCTCHSRRISASFNKLDYIGIVVMIVGSFLPALHYGFYCHPHLQTLYATMIVSLGSLAMYTVVAAKYATPAYRPVRTTIFISLGLSAVIPVVHICAMYGYSTVSRIMGLSYVIASGAMYIIGACLYMARIPERFAPGRFDMVGASHQMWVAKS
ncbi:hypothetical protein OC845_004402 [Tilletia horrida]|nr:hypothetical protein OC845_004402 [Tilletia horrida]